MRKPQRGIYDALINKQLRKSLDEYKEEIESLTEEMQKEEAASIISTYLSLVMEKGFNYYKSNKEDVFKQIEIANKLIEGFSQEIDDREFIDYQIEENKVLKGIFDSAHHSTYALDELPLTPISKSTLFTGSVNEPTVYSELNKEILTADSIDLLVSFIKYSGLRLILPALQKHTKTKPLRIITTSYMGATDYKAVEELSKLPNTTIKISYDTERTRLHAKAYYFYRKTGFSTAYIGSSNISKAALTEGTEWNLKLSEYTSREIIEKYKYTFENYWNSDDFRLFDSSVEENRVMLRKCLKKENHETSVNFGFDIRPYAYQQEILDKLEVEREIIGSKKNLVVAATGTGKTVISAFDFKRYYKENPEIKLLFLAHRKEILEQSLNSFRGILKDYNFGDLWVAQDVPSQLNHVFASVQTLNSQEKYKQFSKDYFDFIILDETHHGSANSYSNLLNYFEPDILLGLTATPERMDGKDITTFFNDRIAYEIRLHEAINRRLLCPFHYFGITDTVNLSDVSFIRGKYDAQELSNIYTGNHMRANNILKALHQHVADIEQVKGIGFCVSIEHAEFMAEFFNDKGIESLALSSNSKMEVREKAKSNLLKAKVKFIFVVDLYNEGVDIPDVNTVLFLRPTESSTIFIQQLGRGLRISQGKDVLTVLDFVGQANKGYNFRTKLSSLIGKTHLSLEEEVKNEFPMLPKGCYIALERKASEYILENLKMTYANKRNLMRMLKNFNYESHRKLNLSNFLNHYQIEPYYIYKSYGFYKLLNECGLCHQYQVKDENLFKHALRKTMGVNSILMIDFFLDFMRRDDWSHISEMDELLLLMWHYTLVVDCPEGDLLGVFYKLRNDNVTLLNELFELLAYNRNNLANVEKKIEVDYPMPLELYAKYNTDQILAGLGIHTINKKMPFREGVKYIADKKTDALFITLNKSEKNFSESTMYEDYAISDTLFHWQSQNRTSDTSPTGQRYIHQRENKTTVLIFIREYKDENGISSPYYFLGKANYVSHEGSKPISIVWELEQKMPVNILKKSNRNAG